MANELPEMTPITGIRTATAESGTGYTGRPDMMMMAFDPGTTVAGVFTRSTTPAAPVRWTKARVRSGAVPCGLVFNAGNANCYTGPQGHELVRQSAARAAAALNCAPESVLICSTGRIGDPLPAEVVLAEIDAMATRLAPGGFGDAARAMMTTDRWPKAATRSLSIGGATVTLHGLTKGTRMIAPNMATTISFIVTDAALPTDILDALLRDASGSSYDLISVDETTSTNDTMLAFATGAAGHEPVTDPAGGDYRAFRDALRSLTREMASSMLDDARGDGKLLEVSVIGAVGNVSARHIARSVTRSLLVRRMIAREDLGAADIPAVGCVLAAVGTSTEPVSPDQVTIRLGGEIIVSEGAVVVPLSDAVFRAAAGPVVTIEVDVAIGAGQGEMRTVLDPSE